ncbi:hypothetical protein [Nonomuraea jabiensis]|uniref:hypothetical protein n=1 Tax=Nonomuraea jabiensis TaxID=882448 RepID=UPI003D73F6FD
MCPWRDEADLTRFTDADMDLLRRIETGVRSAAGAGDDDVRAVAAPLMGCHKDQLDSAHPLRLCAGRLAIVGPGHLRTRMALATGRLPVEAVYPG